MNAGKMRSRMDIQVPIRTTNPDGQVINAWARLRTIYCQVQPVSSPKEDNGMWRGKMTGIEKQFGGKTFAKQTHTITCRVQPERITTNMRLVEYQASQDSATKRVFNISEALVVENIPREIRLEVCENLSNTDSALAAYEVMTDATSCGMKDATGEYIYS